LSLVLGIAANTAVFVVLYTLQFKELPIKDPSGLVAVTGRNDRDQIRVTPIPAVDALSGPRASLQAVCGYNGGVIVGAEARKVPFQLVTALVTGNCFETFGVNPMLGRTINAEDASLYMQGKPVAVISERFWRRAYAADTSVIGQSLRVDGYELTIIGVMPPGFGGLHVDTGIDLFVPFDSIFPARKDRRPGATHIIGRLTPGTTLDQASAQLSAQWSSILSSVLPAELAASERADLLTVRPNVVSISRGISTYRQTYVRPASIALGLTGVLLILVCVNLGGLLMTRMAARSQEFTLRFALGGSWRRLTSQLFAENFILALGATIFSIPTSLALLAVLVRALPAGTTQPTLTFEPIRMVLYALFVGLTAAVLMTIWPALNLRRHRSSVPSAQRSVTYASGKWGQGILAVQATFSVVLIVGAVFLARSLYLLQHAELGVRTSNVTVLRLLPLPGAYRDLNTAAYYPALLDRLQAMPGVQSVGFSRLFPRLTSESANQAVQLLGEEVSDIRAVLETTSPGFFDTVGIPLRDGRFHSWNDRQTTQPVAIVSERLATALSPDRSPVGRRIRIGGDAANQNLLIVGVVGNASTGNPRNAEAAVVYRPALQTGRLATYPNLLVRSERHSQDIEASVAAILNEYGKEYIHDAEPLKALFDRAPSAERISTTVAMATGMLAIVLAFVGIHGHVSIKVSQRWRELGVRLALGAQPRQLASWILLESLLPTLVGLVVGVILAIFTLPVLKQLMYGVDQSDSISWLFVALSILSATVIATIAPARRIWSSQLADVLKVAE